MPSGIAGETLSGCSDIIQIPNAQESPEEVRCQPLGLPSHSEARLCLEDRTAMPFWVLGPVTQSAGYTMFELSDPPSTLISVQES